MKKPTYQELETLYNLEREAHEATKQKLEAATKAAQSLDEPIPFVLGDMSFYDHSDGGV